MKTYYVYELINLMGTVEYVGETYRPKGRMIQHTKSKSTISGMGMFYGRQDLVMSIVKGFDNRTDARKLETELKLSYGLEPTERNASSKNIKKAYQKKSKEVLAYKLDGTFIGEYCSGRECARVLGLQQTSITQVCKGRQKQTEGYTFKYKEI